MEISNLSDAQFKSLVIRILQELTGYLNGIKKTQEEMKVALTEIKIYREPRVEGMTSRTESMIWNTKKGKAFNQNSRKKKELKKTQLRTPLAGVSFNSQIRAHAWVAGQVPSRGCVRGNHTLMFPSFSLPSPLFKNT